MMVDRALFSSDSDEWATPQAFYDLLDAEFHFTLDPCATAENAKCEEFYTKGDLRGGLCEWWDHVVFVNPPYSKISTWVAHCRQQAKGGVIVVMLIPSRTDTRYWHRDVMKAAEIRFVKGRLKFGGANSAPFPSAVVVFRPGHFGVPVISTMERRAAIQMELAL